MQLSKKKLIQDPQRGHLLEKWTRVKCVKEVSFSDNISVINSMYPLPGIQFVVEQCQKL